MTGMSNLGWKAVHDKGAQVSIAFPIEMNMRHGMPPILKMQSLGMEPSLSVDVECTLTADFFTQMRSCMNLQRVVLNEMILLPRLCARPRRLGASGISTGCAEPQSVAYPADRHHCPADDTRCAAFRYDQRRQGAAARRQDWLADAR